MQLIEMDLDCFKSCSLGMFSCSTNNLANFNCLCSCFNSEGVVIENCDRIYTAETFPHWINASASFQSDKSFRKGEGTNLRGQFNICNSTGNEVLNCWTRNDNEKRMTRCSCGQNTALENKQIIFKSDDIWAKYNPTTTTQLPDIGNQRITNSPSNFYIHLSYIIFIVVLLLVCFILFWIIKLRLCSKKKFLRRYLYSFRRRSASENEKE